MADTLHTALLEKLFEGVYYVDKSRTIAYWNAAAESITGFTRDEVIGRKCQDALLRHMSSDGTLLCGRNCPLELTLKDGQIRESELFLHHKDGHRVPVAVRIAPITNETGHIIGAMEMFHDAKNDIAQRERIRQLEAMAFIDPLTGLANRRFLTTRIESRLEELKRYGWPFGLLMADIDHFKQVNDTFGHATGDAVLKMVAATLSAAARSFDLVARFGGEEFVAVVTNLDSQALGDVGERFRSLVASSFIREPEIVAVTISIGGALAEKHDSAASLVGRADDKLYEAKSKGRNRVCY
jgi:diguanylate cyclase (GGDEF)-like protein/PAS domain S-box-containing protein